MEKVWRKVGFSGRTSKSTTTIQSTDTASSAGFGGEHQVQIAALASTATGRRLATSGGEVAGGPPPPLPPPLRSGVPSSLSHHILHQSTASSERRRRRRRKSRPRPRGSEGGKFFSGFRNESSSHQQSHVGETLKQRAVAKLKMFNFHLNWDLHMTQCKPCVPRTGNIFFRNRRGEDNELYRSNSFKFERFERKENPENNSETLGRKVS